MADKFCDGEGDGAKTGGYGDGGGSAGPADGRPGAGGSTGGRALIGMKKKKDKKIVESS